MTSNSNDLVLRFDEPEGLRSVVLEDDGRVAYAYLLQGDSVVGDVWLYNVGKDPEEVNWRDRSEMPFCNPAKFCADDLLPRLQPDTPVSCHWTPDGVEIMVAGLLWARLEKDSRPGWSRNARIAGPLARPLDTT